MFKSIKMAISSDSILKRLVTTTLVFFVVFYLVTIFSHLLLPEGILRGRTSGGLETSSNIFVSTIQIFLFNMMAVICLLGGSIFAYRKSDSESYVSFSILFLIAWAIFDGIVLGTNSFGVSVENMPLIPKLISTFNIVKYCMTWELMGLICIATALHCKAIILTTGKKTITKKLREIKFQKREIIVLVIGFLLMLTGAFIESFSIISKI